MNERILDILEQVDSRDTSGENPGTGDTIGVLTEAIRLLYEDVRRHEQNRAVHDPIAGALGL